MRRIGLVLKQGDPHALALCDGIVAFLKELEKEILVEESLHETAIPWGAVVSDHIADDSDLLVVVGGDGTILRAASLLNDKSIPVLGVNLGRVGFMAEISPDEAIPALKLALEKKADYVSRMMLQITLPNGKKAKVLNEAVIHWGGIARLIDLDIKIGDSRAIEVRADGLIVSTPIGSSAYSYAASGPLMHPEIEGVLLTPICPYAGLKRPLVIPTSLRTEIVLKKGEDLTLTLDGHTRIGMSPGQSIRVSKAPFPFVMAQSHGRDYFEVLKQKLKLL